MGDFQSGSRGETLVGGGSVTILQELRHRHAPVSDALAGVSEVVLVDYPHFPNGGDHLIWLGERAFLSGMGIRTVGEFHMGQAKVPMLRRIVGDRLIVIQGGGNFGDLYPWHQDVKRRIVRSFPDNRIVMFPQSMHYQDPQTERTDAKVFGGHGGLTLVWRDRWSYDRACEVFPDADHRLAPDMAFTLDLLGSEAEFPDERGSGEAETSPDVLMFVRSDKEQALDTRSVGGQRAEITDWDLVLRDLKRPSRGLYSYLWRGLRKAASPTANVGHAGMFGRICAYEAKGWADFAGGCRDRIRKAFRGRDLIVTDRLHGHIVATMLRAPHIVLPNSYGKNHRFFETWTHSDPVSTYVQSQDELVEALERYRVS